MRKVLSFVLVLALVMSSFSMAFAADVPSIVLTDLAGEDYEVAANTLVDLGVVTGNPDKTFGGDKPVTRAEMAAMVCKSLGLTEAGSNSFSDAKNHWGKSWIGLAQSLGIITGYPDGTFKPDANVTYYEALAMLVKALGYNDDSLTGTWPNKYIAQAQKLGITDNVTVSEDAALKGDIAQMIFDELTCYVGKTNKDGEFVFEYNNKGNHVTMLTLLGMELNENQLIKREDSSMINLMPYVGAYGETYTNKDGKIVAIGELKTVFLKGEYNAIKNLFETDDVDYNITTQVAGATVSAIFENAAESDIEYDFVSNAGTYGLVNIEDGDAIECVIAAEITGKRIDVIRSINVWTDNGAAKMVDANDLSDITSDQSLLGADFPLDANDDIDYTQFYLLGVDSLEDIVKNNVVAVYEDGDGEIVKVEVGTNTVSGKITKMNSSGSTATINGTTYDRSGLSNKNTSKFKVGNEVKVYLDYAGEFFNADLISGSADLVAIVLDNDQATNSFDNARIKLFLADGTEKVFEIDEDATLDSTDIDVSTLSALAAVTRGALVKYSVDSSGRVDAFETFDNTVYTASSKVSSKGVYAGREIAANAVIFTISDVTKLTGQNVVKSDLGTTTLAKILDSDTISGAYGADDGQIVALVLNDSGLTDAVYGVVTGHGENDSDAGYYVTMLIDGKSVTYDAKKADYDRARNADYALVFEVKFSASGDAQLNSNLNDELLASLSDSVVTSAGLEAVTPGAFVGSWNNNQLSFTATDAGIGTLYNMDEDDSITVDPDLVVYVWDVDASTPKYKKGTRSDLRSAQAIAFWDIDEDGVADIVTVWK